jgi:hypothetical protein
MLAGAARVSIAPRAEDLEDGVYLGGFGAYRQRRATGVHDEPYCRALVLTDQQTTIAFAALDLVGASGPLLAAIRDDAARLTGIAPEQIIVSCTHSHASPDTQGLWGGVPSAYATHVAHRASSAVWEAAQAVAPATASAASTPFDGYVRNRRGWPETDTALTVLRLQAAGGDTIATLVNYACHPTASGRDNHEVSRDWCGYAVDSVERSLGGIALYFNGALGDVNPARDGGFDAARALGEAVAGRALAAIESPDDAGGTLEARMRVLELPLNFERLDQRVQAAVGRVAPALSLARKSGGLHAAAVALHAAGRADVAQMVAAFQGIAERHLQHRDGRTYLRTHCGYLRIGDVDAFVAPGEVLTRLALPLRASLASRHRLFLGLSQDTLGYFLPEDEWMTGRNNNYEESVSMGKHGGALLADALLSLVPHGSARA